MARTLYEKYLHNLGILEADLRDKRVLDVGAGSRFFAAHVLKENITTEIFSLDPVVRSRPASKLAWESIDEEVQKKVDARTVKAVKESIPLKDESIDLVLANCMNKSKHAKSYEEAQELQKEIEDMFGEFLRVLAPGGEVRIFGLKREESPKRELENLRWRGGIMAKLAELKKQGFKVAIEMVQKENIQPGGSLMVWDRVVVRKPKS